MKKLVSWDDIKLVKQSRHNSCYAACVAMILGYYSDEDVISDLDSEPPYNDTTIIPFLVRNNVYPEMINNQLLTPSYMTKSAVFLASAPSKNIIAGTHAIVLTTDDEFSVSVFDPSKNKTYTTDDFNDGEIPFLNLLELYDCS